MLKPKLQKKNVNKEELQDGAALRVAALSYSTTSSLFWRGATLRSRNPDCPFRLDRYPISCVRFVLILSLATFIP